MWSAALYNHKARYALYLSIGLITILGIVSHDRWILDGIEHGNRQLSEAGSLYFPFESLEQALLATSALVGLIIACWSYAILVRVARWHFENHGVSVSNS